MLVLRRKVGEVIVVKGPAVFKVLSVKGNAVRIGIDAEDDVPILRGEIADLPDPNATDEELPFND